jgi:hypothetical protein
MDEEFTHQVKFVFSTLYQVEQAGTLNGLGGLELKIYTPTRVLNGNCIYLHRVFTSWRIHLTSLNAAGTYVHPLLVHRERNRF